MAPSSSRHRARPRSTFPGWRWASSEAGPSAARRARHPAPTERGQHEHLCSPPSVLTLYRARRARSRTRRLRLAQGGSAPAPQGGTDAQPGNPPRAGAPRTGTAPAADRSGGAQAHAGRLSAAGARQQSARLSRSRTIRRKGGACSSRRRFGGLTARVHPERRPAARAAAGRAGETPDDDLGHRGQMNFRAEVLDRLPHAVPVRAVTALRALRHRQEAPTISRNSAAMVLPRGRPGASAFRSSTSSSRSPSFGSGSPTKPRETNQGKLLQMGFGARLYTMANSRFKVFFSPWLGIDATSGPLEAIGSGSPGHAGL